MEFLFGISTLIVQKIRSAILQIYMNTQNMIKIYLTQKKILQSQ